MPAPDMHPVSNSRFHATCCKCLRGATSEPASDLEHAWAELVTLGWSLDAAPEQARGAQPYAVCPECTLGPPEPEVEKAAVSATPAMPAKRSKRR